MTAEAAAPQPASFSDRGSAAPDSGVGFDTVRLRGPARPELLHDLDELRVRLDHASGTRLITKSGWSYLPVGHTDARVNCNARTGRLEVAVEFSGPMVHVGTNLRGHPLSDLPDTIGLVFDALASQLTGFPRLEQMRVVRLDLPRDFVGINDPSAVLGALALLPCTGRFRQETYTRSDSPIHLQTLIRGVTGHWRANAYDKKHERDELAARRHQHRHRDGDRLSDDRGPRLRWEIQLRHRTLAHLRERYGRELLRSPDILAEIAAHYFHHSEFDRTFRGGPTVKHELLTELAKTAEGKREASRIITYLAAVDTGVELQSHNTIDRAKADLRRHGLTAADLLSPSGAPARLDFEAGQLWRPS